MNHRLDEMTAILNEKNLPKKMKFEPIMLRLKDHERKSYRALMEIGEGTATDVSVKTGRRRAAESSVLNHLARMGYLNKRRRWFKIGGPLVYFYIP
jgi:predicted transcriptional regulator